MGEMFNFPVNFVGNLFNFQRNNEITLNDYDEGYIILVKPRATGVGENRTEAGDVVEIRSVEELKEKFGTDKPFLGDKEKTKLLVFHYPGELSEEEKQRMLKPVYENGQTPNRPQTANEELGEPEITKNRAYGIDYTQILSEKDILIARDPEKGFKKLPTLNLSYLKKKDQDQQTVIKIKNRIAKKEKNRQRLKEFMNSLVTNVFAATESVSVVDPDNGTGTDYTSLNAWEAGEERDLTLSDEIAVAKCRTTNGSSDTTAVSIDGWVTSSTNYIKIWTDPSEGYRHDGTAGSGYVINPSVDAHAFSVNSENVRFEGLEITGVTGNSNEAFRVSADETTISHCLIYDLNTLGSDGIFIAANSIKVYVYNNIFYNLGRAAVLVQSTQNVSVYVYNNTGYNVMDPSDPSPSHYAMFGFDNYSARDNSGSVMYAINNICEDPGLADCYHEGQGGTYSSSSDYNIASDSTSTGGSNDKTNVTVNFLDKTNNDFHLDKSDTVAKDAGKNLSNDSVLAFNDDIDGEGRTHEWDIGADEFVDEITDGLVGHWTFDGRDMQWSNTGAEVRDRSGQGNHGSLGGGMGVQSATVGKIGQALIFDGDSDNVGLGNPSSLQITNEITLSAWVKPSSDPDPNNNGARIISKSDGGTNDNWALAVSDVSGWEVQFTINGNKLLYANGLPANEWSHLIGTYDGSIKRLYINGEEVDNDYLTGSINTANNIRIGRHGTSDSGRIYKGQMDDIRVYNRALSEVEAERLYRQGLRALKVHSPTNLDLIPSGLVGHWTFDGRDMQWSNTGAEVRDRSGQGNHGSLEGGIEAQSATVGQIGQALSFDGQSNYVDMGNTLSLQFGTGDFTFSIWVKTEEDCSGNKVYLGKYITNAVSIWLGCKGDIGKANFSVRSSSGGSSVSSGDSSTIINDGQWYLLTGVKEGNSVKIYVNGQLESSDSGSFGGNFNDGNVQIGRFDVSPWYYADAVFDNARIYSRALLEAEIKGLYREGSGRFFIIQED